ncbi:sulfurtransferase [Rhodobacteraceae bacterium LMO-12]|nr:sulfurtransferase [Rhodobacteraceae bacterium LMO-JJ12]
MFGFLMGGGLPKIAADEAVKGARDGSITVIDVRDHREIAATGKAKGAKHIPMMLLRTKCDPRHPEFDASLDTGKTIALYCATGARSASAGRMLLQLGFKDVRNIGGLNTWVRGGGQIERA